MYCNLHNHTTRGSLLDSIIKTEDLVKFAKTNNQKAVAVTDHGSCAELIALGKYCRQYGVKPIYGCEVYEVDNMWNTDFTKDNPEIRNHLILFAKNQTGYQNLLKLASLAGTKGRYFKPRIDLNEIKKHDWGRGIIASTACLAGRVGRWCVSDIPKDKIMTNINNYIDKLSLVFDDVYLEFQAHNTPDQTKMNKVLCWYLDKHFDKWHDHFIITSDAHMVNETDRELHRVFVATGQAREVGETYKDCYLMTDDDVRKTIKLNDNYVNQAFKNINSLIDSIDDNIDVGLDNPEQMPTFKTPDQYKDNEQYLKALIKQGYKEKRHLFKGKEQIYQDRIKMEFPVIKELGYINYFIVMYLLVNEIRKNNIPLGYARGSAGGCLILYLIGVTQVDSIKWDLDFSRFANIGRKGSPADVDTDVSRRKRQEVIQIIKDLFGKNKVCPLATYNTMTLKVAIRDVGKVLSEPEGSLYQGKIPYSLRDLVAKIVPEDCNDYKQLISTKGIDLYYEQFPKWFEYSFKLAGLPKSRGKHASAIIVAPKPITDYMSLCLDKDKQPLIENEMHNAMDDIGCVKIDLLGLKTLDIIDDTLKFAHLTWNDVDINTLNFKDKKVFDDIYKHGNCVGIFQMEGVEAESMLKKAKADNIEDIVAVNASNRPGTKDEFPDYIKNKLHPEQIKVIHPDLLEIFKQSHSILLYQEQTLSLFRYAGFQENEVDIARRAIGKKLPDVMKSLEQKFRQGLKAKGWTDDQIKSMWNLIVKQSSYSFNRCLTGDTLLRRSGSSPRDKKYPHEEIPISEVYKRFNSKTPVGTKYRSKSKDKRLFIMCLDPDGKSRKHKIKNVYYSGKRPVYTVTLENGKSIKATENHRLLTVINGYKTVKELNVGDELYCCDFVYKKSHSNYNITDYHDNISGRRGKGKHYIGRGFQKGKYNPSFINGGYAKFKKYHKQSNGTCEICGKKTDRIETHHIDGNRKNNEYDNLINLCVSCHKKEHYRKLGRRKRGEKGYDTYTSKIVSIDYAGIEHTYDVEIDSNEHNFFANGICSHNSHAVAYSLLSYLTAYLKEYYPVEFITSCLISSDNKEQINKFILEAKRLGIKYSSPSINKSNETFTPDVKHRAILYGLKSINNFKDGAYDIVIQNRPYKSLKDYFTKTIDIDKTSQIMLIKSGALNELTNKDKFIQTKYLFHYRFINGKETKKPLKSINKKHIEKLFDAGIITKSQTKDKDLCLKLFNKYRKRQQWKNFKDKYLGVDHMTKYINLQFEMESLNTYISGSPFDNVVLPNWKNTPVNNFGNVAGTISQIKVNKIKKGKNAGSKMAFLNIETPDGTIVDITVFADKYRKYRELIEFGKPIVVSGRKDNDRSYIAERIITLEQYVSDTYSIQRGLNENK